MRRVHDCFRCKVPIDMENGHWVRITQFYLHWLCYLRDRAENKWFFYALGREVKPDEEHDPKEK